MKREKCSIEGCLMGGIKDGDGKRYFARGYCCLHYSRWYTHGSPLASVMGDKNTYTVHGNEVLIDLRNRVCQVVGVARVSLDDMEAVLRHIWCMDSQGYAIARIDGQLVRMHRYIMPGHRYIDHKNRERLDNTRGNLRPCTASQNTKNRPKLPGKTSKYYGVSRAHKSWAVYAKFGGSDRRYWGRRATERDAAKLYNSIAKKFGDEFSQINKIS